MSEKNMEKPAILELVLNAIEMTNNMREEDRQIPKSETTELYGANGNLDSMGLVAFLIDIEESLLDEDLHVTLSDERAMSQSRSPFRTVDTLVCYIDMLVSESK
jgi:acyl carrier protein